MKRLTLFAQMALLLALCLAVALAINFATLLETRRNQGLDVAIAPAAQKLADAVAEQTGQPIARPASASRHTPSEVTLRSPAHPKATRLHSAEPKVGQILHQNRLNPTEVRAFNTGETWRGEGLLHLAAKLDDGRRISVRAPGPPALGPMIGWLLLQMLLLFAVIVVPALLLLHRSSRALARLTEAAHGPVGGAGQASLPVDGPRDIRRLTESFNAMRGRISAMIEDRNIMLGAVGHDLRTPLTALRLEAEGVADGATRDTLVAHIEAIAAQLDEIIGLARYGQPIANPKPVDLGAVAERLLGGRQAGGAKVSLKIEDRPICLGDETAISGMLQNLVDNALRYGHRADVVVAQDEAAAILLVRDEGPGIPADSMADAVRPFGRLEPSRNPGMGGHGLGLAIVDQVVRSHGGAWSLANITEGGLEVRVALPLAPATAMSTLRT